MHPNSNYTVAEQPMREAGTALYKHVKRLILLGIEKGYWPPGTALPNEAALAKLFNVSIGTLRRSVDELQAELVLSREQGRGTFVQTHGQRRYLFQFLKIEPRGAWPNASAPLINTFPEVKCINFARAEADPACAAALQLQPGDSVFKIENLLVMEGNTVVHDSIALSAKKFRGLTEKRFVERNGTVYQFYQHEYGVTILRARERTRAIGASRNTAKALGVGIGTPLLEIHRIALSFDEQPIEYRISSVNSTQHDYVTGPIEATPNP
jgi:GntR family transcriptional regulator